MQMRDWVFNERGEPVDIGDDTIDCLRYICADIRTQTKAKPAVPHLPYSRERGSNRRRTKSMWSLAKHGALKQAGKSHWLSG